MLLKIDQISLATALIALKDEDESISKQMMWVCDVLLRENRAPRG